MLRLSRLQEGEIPFGPVRADPFLYETAVTDSEREQAILAELREQFPDTIAVSPGDALKVSGLTSAKNPHNAARQAIYRGTFPFPVRPIRGRKVVRLADIARILSTAAV